MKENKRHFVQAIAAVLTNANLPGFFKGTIWQGNSKKICVPGLNCYSCPGALGSCPIGSLQASLNSGKPGIPYYAAGILILFGVLFGRLICGFLCPFGFLQDLLYKVKIKKWNMSKRVDALLRYLKYVILLLFVIAFPLFLRDKYGIGDPWFCKYICPAGTLEGGIPLLIQNESLRKMVGFLFSWKMFLLAMVLFGSTILYRPFCKYLCPLGAVYGLFNRFSFYQMKVDQEKCTHCGRCEKICKMNVAAATKISSAECIRCGACKEACPANAISSGWKNHPSEN